MFHLHLIEVRSMQFGVSAQKTFFEVGWQRRTVLVVGSQQTLTIFLLGQILPESFANFTALFFLRMDSLIHLEFNLLRNFSIFLIIDLSVFYGGCDFCFKLFRVKPDRVMLHSICQSIQSSGGLSSTRQLQRAPVGVNILTRAQSWQAVLLLSRLN